MDIALLAARNVYSTLGVPVIIPKEGDYVPVEVMMDTLHKAGIVQPGTYLPLRDQAAIDLGLRPH
jgi:hypothetical protein